MSIKDGIEIVEEFVSEHIERDVKSFATNDEIYSVYKNFCKHKNYKNLTKTALMNRLKYLNIGVSHRKTKNYVRYDGRQGVKLK